HWSTLRWKLSGPPSLSPGAITISAACTLRTAKAGRKPFPNRRCFDCIVAPVIPCHLGAPAVKVPRTGLRACPDAAFTRPGPSCGGAASTVPLARPSCALQESPMPLTIAVVVGRLRKDSFTARLAEALARLAPADIEFRRLRIDN